MIPAGAGEQDMTSGRDRKGDFSMNKRTRIVALAALLALCMAGEALWAQSSDWTPWQGKNNADKKEWDEMGTWYTDTVNYLMDAYNLRNNREFADMARQMRSEINALKRFQSMMQAKDRELVDMAGALRFSKQTDGVKFWKKNKARYQAALTAAQQVLQAAEQAKKAEAARLAALPVTEADFTVDITQDGKGVIITSYKGKSAAVKIPATIEGIPVREIRDRAFLGKTITSVVIPEGVTGIGSENYVYGTVTKGAFENCTQLAQVTLPSTLKYIGFLVPRKG
jgi:hypothetical protein